MAYTAWEKKQYRMVPHTYCADSCAHTGFRCAPPPLQPQHAQASPPQPTPASGFRAQRQNCLPIPTQIDVLWIPRHLGRSQRRCHLLLFQVKEGFPRMFRYHLEKKEPHASRSQGGQNRRRRRFLYEKLLRYMRGV